MINIILHSLGYVISSMAVGYIVYKIIYYKGSHCSVKFGYGIISDIDLMIILAVVGLFLSFLR